MLIKRVLPLAVLLGLSITGCEGPDIPSLPIEESELPGRYIGNFGEADINCIDLLPDSIYVAHYKSKDGYTHIDTGKWYFFEWSPGYYNLRLLAYVQRHPGRCDEFPGREELEKEFGVDTTLRTFKLVKRSYGIKFEYCFGKLQCYIKEPKQDL